MSANPEQLDLDEVSLETAFQTLFGAREDLPPWLDDSAGALIRAQDPERSTVMRVADLAQMSQQNDRMFRGNMPALSGVPGQTYASMFTWPAALARWTETLNHRAAELLYRELLPDLAAQGFRILSITEAERDFSDWMHFHFHEHIYPLLTPLAVDPGRPFPFISSDSLNLLVEMYDGSRHDPTPLLARLKIPSITPRLIQLPDTDEADAAGSASFIWTIDLVRRFMSELFVDMPIRREHCFRVLRVQDDITATTEDTRDLRGRRLRGAVVRVDVDAAMPRTLFDWLVDHLEVISYAVVRYESPAGVMSLPELAGAVLRWSQSRSPIAG